MSRLHFLIYFASGEADTWGVRANKERDIMDDSEGEVVWMAILIHLREIEKAKLVEPPLELTVTDANDRVLLDCAREEGAKLQDAFGAGRLLPNWDKYEPPVRWRLWVATAVL